MSLSKPFAATALAHLFISLGHTVKGTEWQASPDFKRLPQMVKAYARAGWYQGSAYFLIAALINYRWARLNAGALTDPIEQAVAGIATAVYMATAAWYTKNGDVPTAGLLVGAGALQVWSGFLA